MKTQISLFPNKQEMFKMLEGFCKFLIKSMLVLLNSNGLQQRTYTAVMGNVGLSLHCCNLKIECFANLDFICTLLEKYIGNTFWKYSLENQR